MMCHRIGRPPTSTIGFGRNSVSSRRRVPNPPHRTTTFISGFLAAPATGAGRYLLDVVLLNVVTYECATRTYLHCLSSEIWSANQLSHMRAWKAVLRKSSSEHSFERKRRSKISDRSVEIGWCWQKRYDDDRRN